MPRRRGRCAGRADGRCRQRVPYGAPPTTAPPAEVGTFQLPRTPGDPQLTRKILEARPAWSAATGPAAPTPRAPPVIALVRVHQGGVLAPGPAELWVINVSAAARGAIPAVRRQQPGVRAADLERCGRGRRCGGRSTRPPSASRATRCVYHADQAPGAREPYQGAVFGPGGPGWTAPRQITSGAGCSATSSTGALAAFCLDSAVATRDPAVPVRSPAAARVRSDRRHAGQRRGWTAGHRGPHQDRGQRSGVPGAVQRRWGVPGVFVRAVPGRQRVPVRHQDGRRRQGARRRWCWPTWPSGRSPTTTRSCTS